MPENPAVDPENPSSFTDGIRCAIAIALAEQVQDVWDVSFNQAGDILGAVGTLAAGVGFVAGIFSFGLTAIVGAGAATLFGVAGNVANAVGDMSQGAFDEAALERFRCEAYNRLTSATITQSFIDGWIDATKADSANDAIYYTLGGDSNFSGLFKAIQLDVYQWAAWTASAVDPAACESCEEDECDSEHDVILTLPSQSNQMHTTPFITSPLCRYEIEWSGTFVPKNNNPTQISDAFWFRQSDWVAGRWENWADRVNWNIGAGMTNIRPIPERAEDHIYRYEINGSGHAWSFRIVDTNFGDNSGSLTVRVRTIGPAEEE